MREGPCIPGGRGGMAAWGMVSEGVSEWVSEGPCIPGGRGGMAAWAVGHGK